MTMPAASTATWPATYTVRLPVPTTTCAYVCGRGSSSGCNRCSVMPTDRTRPTRHLAGGLGCRSLADLERLPHPRVGAVAAQQGRVAAHLDDLAVVNDHDPVGSGGRRQSVGDQQR